MQRWKSSRQTTSEINQPAKSIGGVICTKESPAQKESESEMWSLSKSHEIVIENKKLQIQTLKSHVSREPLRNCK